MLNIFYIDMWLSMIMAKDYQKINHIVSYFFYLPIPID